MAAANGHVAVVDYLIENGAVRNKPCIITYHVEADKM